METLTKQEIKRLLIKEDSAEKYYPEQFNCNQEERKALNLSARIEKYTGDKILMEDYSINQDGSLFLRMALHDKFSLEKIADIYISSFGGFATLNCQLPRYIEKIISQITASQYIYIPKEYLDDLYDGAHSQFSGGSWFYRYFTPWYISR